MTTRTCRSRRLRLTVTLCLAAVVVPAAAGLVALGCGPSDGHGSSSGGDPQVPTSAARPVAYTQPSLRVTADTSVIAWLNACLSPGATDGAVELDVMEVVALDAAGAEVVVSRDDYSPSGPYAGGAFAQTPWFAAQIRGQEIFPPPSGSLTCAVGSFPGEVVHPWGSPWPRRLVPSNAVALLARCRARATGGGAWQLGFDLYPTATASPPPEAEAGASSWFFSTDGYVTAVVGPVPLTR